MSLNQKLKLPKKPVGLTVIVEPKTIVDVTKRGTLTSVCTNVHISTRSWTLGQSVTLQVGLYTAADVLIKVAIIKLAGASYEAWGEDDDYVVNKVLEALEMARIAE